MLDGLGDIWEESVSFLYIFLLLGEVKFIGKKDGMGRGSVGINFYDHGREVLVDDMDDITGNSSEIC